MTDKMKTDDIQEELIETADTAGTLSALKKVVNADELNSDEGDHLESDEEVGNTKRIIGLSVLLVLILTVIGVVVYRFYALPIKVQGQWEAETVNGVFELTNEGKQTVFTMKDLNGYDGVDMVFQSEFVANDMNEYFVTGTTVYLHVSRQKLSDEQICQMIGDGKLLKEGVKTDDKVILSYTKEGMQANFGEQGVDAYFKYMLREFKGLKGTSLVLRNDSFASSGIQFKRK